MNSMLGERFVAYAWQPRRQPGQRHFMAEGAYNNVAEAPKGKVLVGVSAVDAGIIGNYDARAWEGLDLRDYAVDTKTRCGGVGLTADVAAFAAYTLYCLDLLHACDQGNALLEALIREGKRQQRVIVVALSPMGANQYIVSNHDTRCAVSTAVGQGGNPLPQVLVDAVVRKGGPARPFNASTSRAWGWAATPSTCTSTCAWG